MAESVGSIFLDLIVRHTVKKQVSDAAAQAQQQARNSFAAVGKAAGGAVQRTLGSSYNKTLEKAKSRVQGLEGQFDALGAKMDAMRESSRQMFKGVKDPGAAAQRYLEGTRAYQALAAKQEAVQGKLSEAQEHLRIELEAAAAKAAQAQEKAQEKAAAAAERAGQRQKAAAERAAAAQKRESERAAAAAQRAQERAARESERQWQRSTKGIRCLFRTIGGALKATFVTAGLYAFFRAFKSLMSGAAAENKQFTKSLAQVKANLATAFTPIMQAVMPALTSLMNGLAKVTQSVASFIAGLFGTTYAKASAAAKKVQGTGAAAKKAAGQLAAFDQLNVLQKNESGAGEGGGADFDQGEGNKAAQGLGEKVRGFFEKLPELAAAALDRVKQLFAPSLAAWGDAFSGLGEKAGEVWPRIKAGANDLWQNGLAPLAGYLTGTFVPSVVNSFSQAFAPITEGVLAGTLEIFADDFVWRCGLISDAIQNIVLPGLELLRGIWADMMEGVSSTWAEYGKPLVDGVVKLFENIRAVITSVWQTVVQPFLVYVTTKIQELWDESLKPLWDNLLGLFADIGSYLLAGWNNILLPLVNWVVQTFGPYIEKAFESIANVAKTIVGKISDAINVAITALRGLLQFFTAVFQGDWDAAWNAVKDTVANVWNGIEHLIKNTVNGIIGIVNGMTGAVVAGVNAIIRALNSISFDVPEWVPLLGGKHFGITLKELTAPQIPLLAQGGVINQPTLAMMGEYQGAGSNPEIAAPESKLRAIFSEQLAPLVEALYELIAYLREGGDREVIIRFAGSLAELVRLLKPYIDKEGNRVGAKLITGGVY